MKTDREKVTDLLAELGVEFIKRNNDIYCEESSAKVTGYCGFFVTFEFDSNGHFTQIGAWE